MKPIAFALIVFFISTSAVADQFNRGYIRQDGTYVAPHMKSDANSTRYDNYSSQGNTNPYTGQQGSQRNEYSDPPAYNKGYGVQPSPSPFDQSQTRRRAY